MNEQHQEAGPDLSDDLAAEMAAIQSSAEPEPVSIVEQQQQEAQQQALSLFEQSKGEYTGLFQQILGTSFGILAPAWGVSDQEVAALSEAYAEVAATYYPEGIGTLGPWPGAIMCTALVVGPRLSLPRHEESKPDEKAANDEH